MNSAQPAAYNTKMIRDFLEHLAWELRIDALEHTTPGALNPELGDQLYLYMQRYGVSLLPATALAGGDPDPASLAAYHERHRQQAERWLRALEELRPLFRMALKCAATRGVVMLEVPVGDLGGFDRVAAFAGEERGEKL